MKRKHKIHEKDVDLAPWCLHLQVNFLLLHFLAISTSSRPLLAHVFLPRVQYFLFFYTSFLYPRSRCVWHMGAKSCLSRTLLSSHHVCLCVRCHLLLFQNTEIFTPPPPPIAHKTQRTNFVFAIPLICSFSFNPWWINFSTTISLEFYRTIHTPFENRLPKFLHQLSIFF